MLLIPTIVDYVWAPFIFISLIIIITKYINFFRLNYKHNVIHKQVLM